MVNYTHAWHKNRQNKNSEDRKQNSYVLCCPRWMMKKYLKLYYILEFSTLTRVDIDCEISHVISFDLTTKTVNLTAVIGT